MRQIAARVALAAVALSIIAAAPAKRTAMHHATGTFDVEITPEAQAPGKNGALPTSRMAIAKTFSGGMSGIAHGIMLAAGAPKPGSAAAYVAIDQFQGTVDGRAGGFVLLHRGTMTRAGGGELIVTVAPDTGTGALEGIEGTLTIEVANGVHRYDFAYTLPA